MKKVLVTGGAGFIGSHLIEQILKHTDWQVVTLDRFDASGNPNRLSEMLETTEGIDRSRVKFVFWDLKAELNEWVIKQIGAPFDYIMHLAAGTHVDRSVEYPMSFFMDNCIGTVNLLDFARKGGLKDSKDDARASLTSRFLYFSTDEVFGPAPLESNGYKEWDRLNPNNPYAAAKAAAEMACIAYANTYRMPIIITNTMNVVGQRQCPEKFVPLVINKVLKEEKLLIHANEDLTQPGMRHYLHARNISAAVIWILENGKIVNRKGTEGRYNVVGDEEVDNLAFAKRITTIVNEWLEKQGKQKKQLNYELVSFHASRPGHDLRYCLDGTHLKEEGFFYPKSFEESLRTTIFWTLDHPKWL